MILVAMVLDAGTTIGNVMKSNASVLHRGWTRVRVSRQVAAPVDCVWSILRDSKAWLSWYKPLSDFAVAGGGELGPMAIIREREWLWKAESEMDVWDEQKAMGLATRTFNVPGLLSSYYRRIELEDLGGATNVTMTGGFGFGPLGWIFLPYTYPQMTGAMWFEYRSAMTGLAEVAEG